MRNPLTAALAAMAAHAAVSLALGWPFPSAATFVAGMLAVAWAIAPSAPSPRALGGAAGLVFFVPAVLPPGFLIACLAAAVATRVPRADDPLRNVAVALPALTVLILSLTAV